MDAGVLAVTIRSLIDAAAARAAFYLTVDRRAHSAHLVTVVRLALLTEESWCARSGAVRPRSRGSCCSTLCCRWRRTTSCGRWGCPCGWPWSPGLRCRCCAWVRAWSSGDVSHERACFTLVLIAVGTAVGLETADARLLMARESYLTGVVGFWILLSLLWSRPLVFTATVGFMAAPAAEEWHRSWETSETFRRAMRGMTWAFGLAFPGRRLPARVVMSLHAAPWTSSRRPSVALLVVMLVAIVQLPKRGRAATASDHICSDRPGGTEHPDSPQLEVLQGSGAAAPRHPCSFSSRSLPTAAPVRSSPGWTASHRRSRPGARAGPPRWPGTCRSVGARASGSLGLRLAFSAAGTGDRGRLNSETYN